MQPDLPQTQAQAQASALHELKLRVDDYSLERTGNRPLTFTGARIGFGTSKTHNSLEWMEVTIYKTLAGLFVADVDRFSVAEGTGICEAFTFTAPEELVTALQDSNGMLDRATLAACQEAANNDPAFKDGWVEKVP
jgi:hypothetical protein